MRVRMYQARKQMNDSNTSIWLSLKPVKSRVNTLAQCFIPQRLISIHRLDDTDKARAGHFGADMLLLSGSCRVT